MRRSLPLALVTVGLLAATPSFAKKSGSALLQKLAAYAKQSDVVWQPPVARPSPMAGSFLERYVPADPTDPDPKLAGTFQTAPSPCSQKLTFEESAASGSFNEVVSAETGIGLSLGVQAFEIGGSYGRKALAALHYDLTSQMVLTGGLEEMEACCVQSPERCTDEIVSEWWKGTGAVYRLVDSKAGITGAIKQLQSIGPVHVDFQTSKSWSLSNEWAQPMWFAYRTQKVRIPTCEEYMNNSPEQEARVRFTGVSKKIGNEPDAREAARDDARRQVTEYLGTEYQITDDVATKVAAALLSGVKDDLTCVDKAQDDLLGTAYQARVRMYVDAARLDAAVATMKSGL